MDGGWEGRGWDRIGWDWMGLDGMGLDGIGWDWMGGKMDGWIFPGSIHRQKDIEVDRHTDKRN
jgi:hypothetical protein